MFSASLSELRTKMKGEKNRVGSTPCYEGKGCMQVICSSVELYDQIYKRF